MTGGLTAAYDGDTGQVTIAGLPTGAAGETTLIPARGLELVFDRTDGRLARVVIEIEEPGRAGRSQGPGRPGGREKLGGQGSAAAVAAGAGAGKAGRVVTRLFGQEVLEEVRRAARMQGARRTLSPEPGLTAALSRLARLAAARLTSPVPSASPLWAAEEAVLAERARLHDRARLHARLAASGLISLLSRVPVSDELAQTALAVARLAEADDPETARQLRGNVRDARGVRPGPSRHGDLARPTGRAGRPQLTGLVCRTSEAADRRPTVDWSLDRGLVPDGVFALGLSPCADLRVRSGPEGGRLVVEAGLMPGADHEALARCRARLVDPAARRVLAQAPFARAGAQARAELSFPSRTGDSPAAWVEVVDDEHRPVRSERSRRLRRALRWADAAVRAEQRPSALAPGFTSQDWTTLAATAWRHCQYNWERTGDTARAYLAGARLAALNLCSHPQEPPPAWAAELAAYPPVQEPAFLAEMVGTGRGHVTKREPGTRHGGN
jgi:hypothetical protein